MNNNPLVSIFMLTYNHEKYIDQTLEGILMQECDFEYEIVIGDDCSEDNTRDYLLEYNSKYPRKFNLLFHKKNIGMLNNQIETLLKCRGKYIAICDGDDYWVDPYKLQKQVDFLEANVEYGLVHTNFDIYIQQENKRITHNRNVPEGDIFNYLLKGNQIGTLTVLTRTELMQNALNEGILDKGFLMGDYPIWLYIARLHKIGFLEDTTAVYRQLEESTSNTKNSLKTFLFNQSVIDVMVFFAEKYNVLEQIISDLEIKNRTQLNYAYAYSLFDYSDVPYNNLKKLHRLKRKDRLTYLASKLPYCVKLYRIFNKLWRR